MHEPLSTWPRLTDKVSLLKLLPSLIPSKTYPASHTGWHTRERRGWALRWGVTREPHAQKGSARCQSGLLQLIHTVGIKGTLAESSSTARGTQGGKQSSMGTSQPPSQSPASHQLNAQKREKGKEIPMVRDLGASALLHFTFRNKRKADEP